MNASPRPSDEMPKDYWPFPAELPKKPLNDDLVKIDGLKDAEDSPM